MKHVIPLQLVELEENNYHLVLTSRFAGGEELTWVIDTGASKTVFDLTLEGFYTPLAAEEGMTIQSAGIGTATLDTSLGMLREFTASEWTIPSMKVALLDLTSVNALYYRAVGKKICGLMGSDFLLSHRALIDYGKLEMTLRRQRPMQPKP